MKKDTMKKILAIAINFQLIFAQNINVITNLQGVTDYIDKGSNTTIENYKNKTYQRLVDERNGTSTSTTEVRNRNSAVELKITLDRGMSAPIIKDLKNIDEIKTGTNSNYLTKEEFVDNLNNNATFSNQVKNKIFSQSKNLTYKASIQTGNANTTYDYDNKLSIKLGSKSKSMLLEKTYDADNSNKFAKNIILKDPTYKCKSKQYKLMEKILINPQSSSAYYMDVFIKYIKDKKGTKSISSFVDVNNTIYIPVTKKTKKGNKNYIVGKINRGFAKEYQYMENSYHCVRLINNIKSSTCSTGFLLNKSGVCEKKFINQPSPRKTTGEYYTCKNSLGNNKIGVSIALNKNLAEEMTEDCGNIPTTNDRMYYSNVGAPTCVNLFEDNSKNATISKFRYLTNKNAITNYTTSSCVWNTIGNYKVQKNTPLSSNQLYSITAQDKAVEIPVLPFLEKNHTYAFILLSSGTAKLKPADGLRRVAEYSTDKNTILNIKYKGQNYTALANVNSDAIANGYKYITYEDIADLSKLHTDYNEIYETYQKAIDLGKLESNKVYELDTLSKRSVEVGPGYIEESGRIYINGHYENKENGPEWVSGAYYNKTTMLKPDGYVYEVNGSNNIINKTKIYVTKNTDIEQKIEKDTSFTKVVMQDTFLYTGKKQILIPKPKSSWAYKLYIYDVNEYKSIVSYIKSDLYSKSSAIQKIVFNDNSNKKTFPYKLEYTDSTCSNADLGAKVYKKCTIRTTLFKTNLASISPVLRNHTCYTYYSYDNNNNYIKKIITDLSSKSKLINNLNNKTNEFYFTEKFDIEIKNILQNVINSEKDLKSNNDKMYSDLTSFYKIKTTEGKKELDNFKKTATALEIEYAILVTEAKRILTQIDYLSVPNPYTDAEALILISKLEAKKLSSYDKNQQNLNNFLNSIKSVITKYEFKDEYADAYNIFLNNYIKRTIDKLNKDFKIKVDKYDSMIEEEKLFVEDVFSETYKDKNGNAFRRLLSGAIIPLGKINLNSNLVTVAYKPACKLDGQLIDCDDEIIKSKNVCKTSEIGKKSFCPSGTTDIGNELCAQENCSIGYSFRKFTLGNQSFLGCVKSDAGNFGCEKDSVKSGKDGKITPVEYSLKYLKENGKTKLKCSSTPIFPKFGIKNIDVSSKLSRTFLFDSHTFPRKISVDKLKNYTYNENTDEYDLTELEGTMFYNPSRNNDSTHYLVKYKWVPGYTKLFWFFIPGNRTTLQIQNGFKICHHGCSSRYQTSYLSADLFKDISASNNLNLTFDCNNIMDKGNMEMYPALGTNNVYTPAQKISNLDIRHIPASKMPVWCVNTKELDGCTNNDPEIGDCLIKNNSINVPNKADRFCYIKRPTLKNSCLSTLFEQKTPVKAFCDIYNGFKENAIGKCERTTYAKAIKNKDYYCPIVPDRFNPFDGGQASFTIESLKNLANDSTSVTSKSKSINFDIAIKRVSITAPIEYQLENKVPVKKYNDDSLEIFKSKSIKYYWNDNLKNAMFIPSINIHKYNKTDKNTLSYTYVNDDKNTKYNGFLLNKKLNKSFNFNSIDEKAMYQKNIFNVHLEDEVYETFNVNYYKRFGAIKNAVIDNTPSSLGNKYKCLYDYSIFELPDCNKGISTRDRQEYNISFNSKLNGYVCSVNSNISCKEGIYDKLLKKCIINTNSTCPEEITKDGKVYRKSLGEIKQIKDKKGNIYCKLKKLKCDDLSVEGKCPTGFVYNPTAKSKLDSACVFNSGIENTILIEKTLTNKVKLNNVKICPSNDTLSYFEQRLSPNTKNTINWRVNGNTMCERNNYVPIGLNTLHLKYNLSPVLNIANDLNRYNILSSVTYRNNVTGMSAKNLYNEGYTNHNNYLTLPIVIVPTSSDEEVLFSLTGFGMPINVKTLNSGNTINYDKIKASGLDIIKGFNDTSTMIINQKLSRGKARIILYTWDLSRMNPNNTLNYFCENAICGIIPVTKQIDKLGKTINVFSKINNQVNTDKYLFDTVYNQCNLSDYPYQDSSYVKGVKKAMACYNIETTSMIDTKNVTILEKENNFFKTGNIFRNNTNEKTIYANVNFDTTKSINYLCDYNSGWSLAKKTYKFASISAKTKIKQNTEYYVCEKRKVTTVGQQKETITLIKDINTINTYSSIKLNNGKEQIKVIKTNIPLKTNFDNNTDNLCYYGLFNNEKTTSTDSVLINNYGVFGSNSSSGSNVTTNGNYQDIGTDKFIINFEEQNIYGNNDTKIKLKTGLDNVYNKPFYCVDADNMLNNMDSIGILNYNDLGISKKLGLNAITNFKLIAEYEDTINSNKIISNSFPRYLSNIVIKEKNNRRPQLSDFKYSHYEPYDNSIIEKERNSAQFKKEVISFNNQKNNINLLLYDKTRVINKYEVKSKKQRTRIVLNNKNGTPSLIDISKIKRNREMCFIFDLQYMSDIYDISNNKIKPDYDINQHNKQKVNKFYMVSPSSCEEYIQPYDKTKMAAAIAANPYLKEEFNKIQLMKQSDFKAILTSQEVVDKTQRCVVKIKCISGYKFNSTTQMCESKINYIANKYSYLEDYVISFGTTEKIVTLQVDDVNKTFENLTRVLNGKKVPNSLRESLVCDDGSKPLGNVCLELKTIPAECKIPFYSNGKYLDYNLYTNNNAFKTSLPNDSYYCSFFKPYNVMQITTVMPKINIKKLR